MTCVRCGRDLAVARAAIVRNARGALGSIHVACILATDVPVHVPGAPLKATRRAVDYPPDWPGEDVEAVE